MEIFALSFLVIVLAMLGMGLGVLFGHRPIRGTCGGGSGGKEPYECMSCSSRQTGKAAVTVARSGAGGLSRNQAGTAPGPDY